MNVKAFTLCLSLLATGHGGENVATDRNGLSAHDEAPTEVCWDSTVTLNMRHSSPRVTRIDVEAQCGQMNRKSGISNDAPHRLHFAANGTLSMINSAAAATV